MQQARKLERKRLMDELTRKDILDSAVSVLVEKGMKEFTMDHVAAGAGIAKGTLYLHFKSKEELLDSVVAYCFEPVEREYAAIIRADRDPVWKLEQCALASMKHTAKNRQLLGELRSILFNSMDQDISDRESWYWVTTNLFVTVLDEAVEAGLLRPMNTTKVAALFLYSIYTLMAHRVLSPGRETIEEDVHELMDLYLNGLGSGKVVKS